ncbi:MAG: SH3 domain-containing protein [Anaerolineae bacterium]|nr:SH3 domain-containing protein [Anaerolineae bacterium]
MQYLSWRKRILAAAVIVITLVGSSLPTLPALTHAAEPEVSDNTLPSQTLPSSPFYAWAYSPIRDVLYLLNASGLVTSIPRPKLPNEVTSIENPPVMSFSPDGQMMLLAATLSNGQRGLGFYNLATGQFVQTHTAQPNENIMLGSGPGLSLLYPTYGGSPYAFTTDSSRVAVGFAQQIVSSAWRLIVFNVANGQVQALLDNTNPQTTSTLASTSSWFPRPMFYEGSGATAQIHIQFILGFAGGSSQYPALAWNPTSGAVIPSNLVRSATDILPTTSAIVFPSLDPAIPALEPNGPFSATNVIQRNTVAGIPTGPVTLHTDSTNYVGSPSWAGNGQLVVYSTFRPEHTAGQGDFWVLGVESGIANQLSTDTRSVYPTIEGFLRADALGQIFRHGIANPTSGQLLWQSQDEDIRLLWANPPGSTFRLASVSGSTTTSPGTSLCTGAPASRVSVGATGRVTISNTNPSPLRMRSAPGGAFVTSLPEGTQFTIQGGPQCQGNYTWWQIRLSDGRTGWVAEGDASSYFIEPFDPATLPTGDAIVNTSRLNLRESPGTGGRVLTVLAQNQGVRVVGRLADNSWIQVQTSTSVTGWVLAQYLTININLSTVPIVNASVINAPTATIPLATPVTPFNVFVTADTYVINAGNCATISWNITGASQVLFDGAFVNLIDARTVCPPFSTTYTLLVTPSGSATAQSYPVLITVNSGY